MRRPQRRPMYYWASSLLDGTVLGTFPMRKPLPKVIKREHLKIDEDGICKESLDPGKWLCDDTRSNRFRFQDIVANRHNTRRAIRELALPELAAIREEVAAMRSQLDRIERLLGERREA